MRSLSPETAHQAHLRDSNPTQGLLPLSLFPLLHPLLLFHQTTIRLVTPIFKLPGPLALLCLATRFHDVPIMRLTLLPYRIGFRELPLSQSGRDG